MAGLVTTASVLMCPHGGQVTIVSSNARTKAAGSFVARASDSFTIAGCPFVIGVVPHPCVLIHWAQPAARSQAVSDFTVTDQSLGLCSGPDQAVQGSAVVTVTQPRGTGQ